MLLITMNLVSLKKYDPNERIFHDDIFQNIYEWIFETEDDADDDDDDDWTIGCVPSSFLTECGNSAQLVICRICIRRKRWQQCLHTERYLRRKTQRQNRRHRIRSVEFQMRGWFLRLSAPRSFHLQKQQNHTSATQV